eukprot:1115241-Alexandrium_andersonii.AAC.1
MPLTAHNCSGPQPQSNPPTRTTQTIVPKWPRTMTPCKRCRETLTRDGCVNDVNLQAVAAVTLARGA